MILIGTATDSFDQGQVPTAAGEVMAWEEARHYFYHDVDEVTARRAWQRLRRQSMGVLGKPFPLSEWPRVPTTCIVMTDHHSVNPAWERRYAKEILEADVIELPGGHSPFYSQPQALIEALASL